MPCIGNDAARRGPKGLGFLRQALLLTALFTAPMMQTAAAAGGDGYRVAGGDVLSISVYGDPNLTGQFVVGSDGTIAYPILGTIPVGGRSVEEIGEKIGQDLAAHIANPSVTVAVKEFAPVFVTGDIQKPGKVEFRPGMIVLELFALGGGLPQQSPRADMSAMQLIAAQQEYEDMALQLLSKDVQRVRLQAELDGSEFDYEQTSAALVRDPEVVKGIVSAERNLFNMRKSMLEDEKSNLEAQRQTFSQEIETLEKSATMRNQQFDLLGLDVNASAELVNRGAASQSALRERQRELLAMHQQVLENGSFLARARQNKSEVERRILELQAKRRNDALIELRELDVDMLRLRKKMSYAVQSMAEIGVVARKATALDNTIQTTFVIDRAVDGERTVLEADEHTKLQAGDILIVRLAMPGNRNGKIATAATGKVN